MVGKSRGGVCHEKWKRWSDFKNSTRFGILDPQIFPKDQEISRRRGKVKGVRTRFEVIINYNKHVGNGQLTFVLASKLWWCGKFINLLQLYFSSIRQKNLSNPLPGQMPNYMYVRISQNAIFGARTLWLGDFRRLHMLR